VTFQPVPQPEDDTAAEVGAPQASSQAPAARDGEVQPAAPSPAPKAAAQELVPRAPVVLSAKMRALLGRSPYRDPAMQLDAEALRGVLAAEFTVDTAIQLRLVDRLSVLFVDIDGLQSTVQTAVDRKQLDAARDVLCPDFIHFYPPPPGAVKTNGMATTAYGEFMADNGALARSDQAELVAQALARLADHGQGEPALRERAYILALPEIVQLEKILASKQAEAEALIEQLLRLKDRRDHRNAISSKAAA
jgi:hypothetical protein